MSRFSTSHAIFISLMAASGLAIKPVIGPFMKLISAFLLLPGGTFAGAIYLIWPFLALAITRRRGSAVMVGVLQGSIVMITGLYGSHGLFSLLTYTFPCLIIELIYMTLHRFNRRLTAMLATGLANGCGSFLVGYLFLHLPLVPLFIGILPAIVFGSLAGLLALKIEPIVLRAFPVFNRETLIHR